MNYLKQLIPSGVKSNIGEGIYQLNFPYRLATSRKRVLPDFIIIGAMKAGTTSLFFNLCQHPQLVPYSRKEVHFFAGGKNPNIDTFEKGELWYRAHFPLMKKMNAGYKTFEASPIYLYNPLVPKRISNIVPEVKIIALLRNPTERAISHYFHEKRRNRETLSLYEALQAEEQRLEPLIAAGDYKSTIFQANSYKSRGLYKEQIERYLEFFSREQLLLLNSEDFFREPDIVLKRVFEFVGVNPEFEIENLKSRNIGSNKTKVDPYVYDYLNNYFLPHNQALYELVGENYGW